MTRLATPTRYPCARCGKQQPADRMAYSKFTHKRYCPLTDEKGCDRRTKKVRARDEGDS